MTVLVAIGVVVLAWLAVGAACVGWGSRFLALAAGKRSETSSLAARFWAGFAVLLGSLQLWHLVLPVDWRATLVLVGGGWLALYRSGLGAAMRAAWPKGGHRAVLIVLALWLAYRGLDYPRNFDSGLYHFASIRWANEFPIVPGLANLHDRFGFNQSQFLYAALLNVHPFTNEGYHAANNLLFLALIAQLLERITRLRENAVPAMSSWVACVMLPIAISRAADGHLSSPTPDLAVFAVGVAAFLFALRTTEEGDADFAVLPALLVAGCTLKLSFAAYAVALAGGLIVFAPNQATATSRSRRLVLFVSCALAWGLPYAVRGAILSGYPAFPATILASSGDWRLPPEEAQAAANWILSWARAPGLQPAEVLGSWQWLGPWWQRVIAETHIPVALALAAGCGLLLASAAGRRKAGLPARAQVFGRFIPLLVAIGVWFFSAPDPRFGDWLIWLATAWLVAAAAQACLRPPFNPALLRMLSGSSIGAALVFAMLAPGLAQQPRRFGWHSFHRVEVRTYETLSGLRILVPAPGADNRLWDSPLPSSPYEKPNLELRGNSLRDGFRTRTP